MDADPKKTSEDIPSRQVANGEQRPTTVEESLPSTSYAKPTTAEPKNNLENEDNEVEPVTSTNGQLDSVIDDIIPERQSCSKEDSEAEPDNMSREFPVLRSLFEKGSEADKACSETKKVVEELVESVSSSIESDKRASEEEPEEVEQNDYVRIERIARGFENVENTSTITSTNEADNDCGNASVDVLFPITDDANSENSANLTMSVDSTTLAIVTSPSSSSPEVPVDDLDNEDKQYKAMEELEHLEQEREINIKEVINSNKEGIFTEVKQEGEPAKKKKRSNSVQLLQQLLEADDRENVDYKYPSQDDESSQEIDIKPSKTKPFFMHIDTEKDEDKATTSAEQDEVAIDPIGEAQSDWTQEDAECIVPDSNQTQGPSNIHSEENNPTAMADLNRPGPSNENPEWVGKYVVNISNGTEAKPCMICGKELVPKYTCSHNKIGTFICSEPCLRKLKERNVDNVIVRDLRVKDFTSQLGAVGEDDHLEIGRLCAECKMPITNYDQSLSWECLEFCNVSCIKGYQKKIGTYCASCQTEVAEVYLGKYCVRFGFDIRQFCSGACLVKYKKDLKICSYCRENITEPYEETHDLKNIRKYCSQECHRNYKTLRTNKKKLGNCAVCHMFKPEKIELCDPLRGAKFCGEPCFMAFKYVNNIVPEKCEMCLKYYEKKNLPFYMVTDDGSSLRFCSKTCQNVYISINRKIVSCCWCKVKKYNFDMIQRCNTALNVMWCSLNCQKLYELNITAKRQCSVCLKTASMNYHISSDIGLKSFCSYKCVRDYQISVKPMVPPIPSPPNFGKKGFRRTPGRKPHGATQMPIITSVRSLAPGAEQVTTPPPPPPPSSPEILENVKYLITVQPPELHDIRNVATSVKALTTNEETQFKPDMVDKETQTDIFNPTDMEVIPVPIYIPQPIHMFNFVHARPTPFPLPIPIPILIPMTKAGTNSILKEVKASQPTPSDPYEADLLVMAQLVADANDKEAYEEHESDGDDATADEPVYSPEAQEQSTSFGDDVLQMALHMATDFTEPAVDLEGALQASTITATPSNAQASQNEASTSDKPERNLRGSTRKRGRGGKTTPKSTRKTRSSVAAQPEPPQNPTPEPPAEPAEKPDANMCLKYTFGVNAWKQWISNKHSEVEKFPRTPFKKPLKTDLLQLSSDELNYSLCMFIKEVRKPNGAEYAPDTIYYLCLGIQQYLFENGRIDNIFCDPYFELFTDCLDEICKKFATLYNDSQYIVTRVEEEHLWESKQLGPHSPHVLLSTLMFFNTKHFNLSTVEEHMQLSFSHIMKHWKRAPNSAGSSKSAASRNILLRFYPPQSATDGNRKKKVYEQQENDENPFRCPVKLYEFYLSKCPESVKTRNDVFYLQPERSCVPDSPVWYSTMALGKDSLEKMLHRVKMVKEINVALLSS